MLELLVFGYPHFAIKSLLTADFLNFKALVLHVRSNFWGSFSQHSLRKARRNGFKWWRKKLQGREPGTSSCPGHSRSPNAQRLRGLSPELQQYDELCPENEASPGAAVSPEPSVQHSPQLEGLPHDLLRSTCPPICPPTWCAAQPHTTGQVTVISKHPPFPQHPVPYSTTEHQESSGDIS